MPIPVNTRDRSRSPVRRQASPHSKANNSEEPEDYEILHLQNLPKNWTHSAVRTLIRGYIPEPDIVKSRRLFIETVPNKNRSTGEYVLKHTEQETCRHLYNLLKGITYLGNPVEVRLEKESSFPQIKLPRSYRINKNLRWDSSTNKLTPERPFFVAGPHKFESTDYFQTYGLSTSFLDSLNVKPPLINRIYVGNLDPSVNELKLRQIFSHAGIVLSIVLIRKDNKSTNYARIEYDHPVEAIQAISMFNNKILNKNKLTVDIDKAYPQAKNLPQGLQSIAQGLAVNGEPLRGIRNAVELSPFKQFVMKEIEKLNNDKNKVSDNTKSSNNIGTMSTSSSIIPNNSFTSNRSNQLSGELNMNIFDNNLMSSITNLFNPQNVSSLLSLQGLQNYLNTLSVIQSQSAGQNSTTGQNVMATIQNMMGISQNVMGAGKNIGGTSQSMMGTDQNIVGTGQNIAGTGQNIVSGAQNMMGANQNMMSNNRNVISSQNIIDASQNMMGTNQNMMRNNRNVVSSQNIMNASQNMMTNNHNMISGQNMMDASQNMMGINQNMMSNNRNVVSSQNIMNASQNMMTNNQNMISSQNMMDASQNMMGTNQNMMSTDRNINSQNIMDASQNIMNSSQKMIGSSHNMMGIGQNVMGTTSQNISVGQNSSNSQPAGVFSGGNQWNNEIPKEIVHFDTSLKTENTFHDRVYDYYKNQKNKNEKQ